MEKQNIKKKRKLKWQFKILMFLILIFLYAFFIGTKGIFIEEFKIQSNKIDKNMHGLKIIHFSDLLYGSTVNIKTVKTVVKKINDTKPDIVIFCGDLIYNKYKISTSEKDKLIKQLSNINAELGKYYVTEEDVEQESSILNLSGFTNLDNKEQLIYSSSTKPILLLSKKNAKSYLDSNQNIENFKLLIIHNPDDYDKFKDYNFDLVLAGYTLNGQINIPKIKDLLIDSKYKKNYQKLNNTKLFINPGIGTKKIKARLFNHPTIYLYRLNKAST